MCRVDSGILPLVDIPAILTIMPEESTPSYSNPYIFFSDFYSDCLKVSTVATGSSPFSCPASSKSS